MKNVVITGSTKGLGLAMAREFLKAGCSVAVSGRNEQTLEAARGELSDYGARVFFLHCDVQNPSDLDALWCAAQQAFGPVDIWINNAGQAGPYLPVHNTEASCVDAVIDTNLKGLIFGTQTAARHMLEQGGGAIWNMEGLGSQGEMQTNTTLYTTTKQALTHFTRCMAKELAQTPVRIGRLSPGLVLTDFILKSPQGEPSAALDNPGFRSIVNILAERPETIAAFFVPRIMASRHNDDRIAWLTKLRAFRQFAKAPFIKRHMV